MESPPIQFAYKVYQRTFRVPVRTSQEHWAAREGAILRVETEEGAVGFGEIAPFERWGTETLAGAVAWCATLGRRTALDRLRAVPRGLPCCAAAVSAIVAELEKQDQAVGKPVDGSLPVALLLPTGTAAIDALARGLDRGFATFKIKIGTAGFDEERTLLGRLIERLPSHGRLRCDANGALDARMATRWLAAVAEWPVEFVEQPLPAEDRDDIIALAHDFPTAIALDEAVRGPDDIKRWRDLGWPGLFVIKPGLAGDRVALLDEMRTEPGRFVFSSALESAVGMKAGIELAMAARVTRALGYGVGAFFEDDGLGGGWNEPRVDATGLEQIDPAEVWNRL